MIKLYKNGAYLINGTQIVEAGNENELKAACGCCVTPEEGRKGTIAYSILMNHNTANSQEHLKIRFDAMASHDITYVGIIQTARASGMERFPLPYVLTNCHNSLCAVGGTINEDDHVFGLSAAKKYGGIFVPPHLAVIHQYMREKMATCGSMILGSDSHTRYGALGTMAMGEGGGELVKQLLEDTYDIAYPDIVGVYLDGKPNPAVGPHDIAIALVGAVFKNGYVKNKVMEFIGPGVASMNTDYRNSVDVMTTETTCLSSVWRTDEDTKAYLTMHGRKDAYKELNPAAVAYYDGMIYVDLSKIKPMIAMPMHPSRAFTIDDVIANGPDILRETEEIIKERLANKSIEFSLTDKLEGNRLRVQQGVIAGCAGGNYTNIEAAAHVLKHHSLSNDVFTLDVYPSSQPVGLDLLRNGTVADLTAIGAVWKTAFCGPCFGAGDTPANNAFSIRHTTRNFPNREGSKPGDQEKELVYGPNIKDWPEQEALAEDVLLKMCSVITDPVTTTDELIPSGETSSYRSNPLGLAEFTLSRRDPEYVGRAKEVKQKEELRLNGETDAEVAAVYDLLEMHLGNVDRNKTEIGSVIYCTKPGDGSAREQAASCQRVLGGLANICKEYATKRYRSNVINWGMLPFQVQKETEFAVGDYVYVPHIRKILEGDMNIIKAYLVRKNSIEIEEVTLYIADLTSEEREIIRAGCLINYNRNKK